MGFPVISANNRYWYFYTYDSNHNYNFTKTFEYNCWCTLEFYGVDPSITNSGGYANLDIDNVRYAVGQGTVTSTVTFPVKKGQVVKYTRTYQGPIAWFDAYYI